MGADNMRKLMEAAEALTEKVRTISASKVKYPEDEDGYPSGPLVKGLENANWQLADHREFNKNTFSAIASAVSQYGLHVYVIYDTDGDYYWFTIAK